MIQNIHNGLVAFSLIVAIYFLNTQISMGESGFEQGTQIAGDSVDLSSLSISPEEQQTDDIVNDAQLFLKYVKERMTTKNGIASNSGVQQAFIKGVYRILDPKKLTDRMRPDGTVIGMRELKQLLNISDSGRRQQVKKFLEKAKLTFENHKVHLKRASWVMTFTDPLSKGLGAAFGGDFYAAYLHILNGSCKIGVTYTAAALGGPASMITGGVADLGYDYIMDPLVDAEIQFGANLNAIGKYIENNIIEQYSDIEAGDGYSVSERIDAYMKGKITQKQLKGYLEPARNEIHKRMKEKEIKKREMKDKVIALLSENENNNPNIGPFILRLENEEPGIEVHNQLLKVLKKEHLESCKHKVSREFVANGLKALNKVKLDSLFTSLGVEFSESLKRCLCPSGYSYERDTDECVYHGPLWARIVKGYDASKWDSCSEKHLYKDGRQIFGIVMNRTKQIVRENALKKAAEIPWGMGSYPSDGSATDISPKK